MDESMIKKLNAAISAVFVAAGAILLVSFLNSRAPASRPAAPAAEPPKNPETAFYDDLAGMPSIDLAEDFSSWTPEAQIDDAKARAADLAVTGKIARAYLFVRASLDGKPLSKYESVYVKLNDAGGHLFRPRSLAVPPSDATALLYALDDVSYLASVPYDESRTPETADLAAQLQPGKTVHLTAFISSLHPALLEALWLYYVCEEGEPCAIVLR